MAAWRRVAAPALLGLALCAGALAVKVAREEAAWEAQGEGQGEGQGEARSWLRAPSAAQEAAEARFGAARHGLRALSWGALLCWLAGAAWWAARGYDAQGAPTPRRAPAAAVTLAGLALWLWLSWVF